MNNRGHEPQGVMGMGDSIVDVLKVSSSDVQVECPQCCEAVDGFINDPRGGVFECDQCGERFSIDENATVKFW